MSAFLACSITAAQILLGLVMACASFAVRERRIGSRGSTACIRTQCCSFSRSVSGQGTTLYFEAALIVALLGFVSTVALAKFLLRGEVIE
jgi:multicomponent K+:H+ antiporter subunit F